VPKDRRTTKATEIQDQFIHQRRVYQNFIPLTMCPVSTRFRTTSERAFSKAAGMRLPHRLPITSETTVLTAYSARGTLLPLFSSHDNFSVYRFNLALFKAVILQMTSANVKVIAPVFWISSKPNETCPTFLIFFGHSLFLATKHQRTTSLIVLFLFALHIRKFTSSGTVAQNGTSIPRQPTALLVGDFYPKSGRKDTACATSKPCSRLPQGYTVLGNKPHRITCPIYAC
jgi:hypothetical protein